MPIEFTLPRGLRPYTLAQIRRLVPLRGKNTIQAPGLWTFANGNQCVTDESGTTVLLYFNHKERDLTIHGVQPQSGTILPIMLAQNPSLAIDSVHSKCCASSPCDMCQTLPEDFHPPMLEPDTHIKDKYPYLTEALNSCRYVRWLYGTPSFERPLSFKFRWSHTVESIHKHTPPPVSSLVRLLALSKRYKIDHIDMPEEVPMEENKPPRGWYPRM